MSEKDIKMAREERFLQVFLTQVPLVIVCHAPGGDSHMKGAGMLVGHFELNLQTRPIWAWPNLKIKLIFLRVQP